jgi:hypothetical protein
LWEATNNRWNQWVLNYSQARQLNLLRNIGFSSPSWEDLSTLLMGVIVGVSLLGAAWIQWERMRQDPWLRLLHGARRNLQKAGWVVSPESPPRQLAAALQAHASNSDRGDGNAPGAASKAELEQIQDWLLSLEAWRYARSTSSPSEARAALGTLRRQFRQIHWPQNLNPQRPNS